MFTIKAGNNPPEVFNDELAALSYAKGRWPTAGATPVSSAAGVCIAFIDDGRGVAIMEGPVTPATLARWRSAA